LTLGLAFIFPGVIGLAGALQPDYSHVSDAVSALGAPDAVMPGLMNIAGFGLAGVLMLLFAALTPLMTAVSLLSSCGSIVTEPAYADACGHLDRPGWFASAAFSDHLSSMANRHWMLHLAAALIHPKIYTIGNGMMRQI
jgi:hypothetical protein